MINIPGKLRIMIDRNIRYGNNKFLIYFGIEDNNKKIYNLESIKFNETSDNMGIMCDPIFIDDKCCQTIINDLYRIGFRPSEEIKKDDLIRTLQKEIEKRDKWKDEWEKMDNDMINILKLQIEQKDRIIEALMSQFVFKDNNVIGRKILTD